MHLKPFVFPTLSNSRNTLQKWLSLFTGVIILFYSALNTFMLNQMTIGTIQVVIGSLCIYFFWKANKESSKKWHRYTLMALLTIAVLHVVYTADLRAGSIHWLIVLALIYCMLAGTKIGLLCTLALSIPSIIIIFIRSDTDNNIPHRAVINFTLTYFTAWGVCHLYESQRYKTHQQLKKMALEDALTGLQNRHALQTHFEQLNTTNTHHFLLVDIDYFKNINDQYGHDVGDDILVDMAEHLKRHIDESAIYRLGGEEFIITLKDTEFEEAHSFAQRLRISIENTKFYTEQGNILITISAGLTPIREGQTFNSVFKAADKNLYMAKNQGRNCVCFNEEP